MHASPGRFSVSTGKLGAAMALNEPECLAVALSLPLQQASDPQWTPGTPLGSHTCLHRPLEPGRYLSSEASMAAVEPFV